MTDMKTKKIVTNQLNASLADIARQTIKSDDVQVKESVPIISQATDGWSRFKDYATQYNEVEGKSRGATVWIDEEVKAALEKIKSTGACNVPVRHLVSAAVRTFIEEHKEKIQEAINAQTSSLL